MNLNLILLLLSLFYLMLVAVLHFNRKKEKSLSYDVYNYIILIAFGGIIFDLLYVDSSLLIMSDIAIFSVHNIILILLVCLVTLYLFFSSVTSLRRVQKKVLLIVSMYLVAIGVNLFLYLNDNFGTLFNLSWHEIFLYSVVILSIFSWLGYIVLNVKKMDRKKIAPVIVFTLFFLPVMYIRSMEPSILIITPFVTYLAVLMYHTFDDYEEKMLSEELAIAREQIEKANFAREEFLAEMSHQIRTPLNTIVGYSQIIEEQNISDNIKEDVANIKSASANLLDLVNNIIDVSKITVDQLEIVNDEYDVQQLVSEVVAIATERIGQKEIKFNVDIDKNIPKYLYGDYHRMKQIMVNMLANAIKQTEKGEINFKIETEHIEEKCRLVIVIENSGVIVHVEDDKMFEKYEQLNTGQFQPMEESDLNVALTSRLVELMNGSLIISDEVELGTKITISVVQKIVDSFPKKNLESIIHCDINNLNLIGKRVLLVDDNKINLKVTTKLLTNYDLKVDGVFSGQECLEKINNGESYDLIFLDAMMPNMSGIETLQKLRKIKNFQTPVVVLTANATIGMRDKYLKDGFNDYVAKPVERKELEGILITFFRNEKDEKMKDNLLLVNLATLAENGIDVEKGVEFLGGVEAYNEILNDFQVEAPKKLNKLDEHRREKDLKNYAVLAHSFKTDAKYLGFTKLIDMAYRHEMESKNENLDYINNHFDELNKEVIRVYSLIKKYLK